MRVVSCLVLLILNVASGTAQASSLGCIFYGAPFVHDERFRTSSDESCHCFNAVIRCVPRARYGCMMMDDQWYVHLERYITNATTCICEDGTFGCSRARTYRRCLYNGHWYAHQQRFSSDGYLCDCKDGRSSCSKR